MKKTGFKPKPAAGQGSPTSLDDFVGLPPATTGEKMKRFTFDVSESLHRRVKGGCAARGIEMADLMRAYLEKEFPEL
jgi:hypothetical protein